MEEKVLLPRSLKLITEKRRWSVSQHQSQWLLGIESYGTTEELSNLYKPQRRGGDAFANAKRRLGNFGVSLFTTLVSVIFLFKITKISMGTLLWVLLIQGYFCNFVIVGQISGAGIRILIVASDPVNILSLTQCSYEMKKQRERKGKVVLASLVWFPYLNGRKEWFLWVPLKKLSIYIKLKFLILKNGYS